MADEGPDEVSPARAAGIILDANSYLTLATVGGDGRPWASPVWFAARGLEEFLWVSDPGTRHSQNIAAVQDVALVVFDSSAPPGDASAVYVEAIAEEVVDDAERSAALAVYNRRSQDRGLRPWTEDDVTGPARHRLYRARTRQAYVLGDGDRRIPVP